MLVLLAENAASFATEPFTSFQEPDQGMGIDNVHHERDRVLISAALISSKEKSVFPFQIPSSEAKVRREDFLLRPDCFYIPCSL